MRLSRVANLLGRLGLCGVLAVVLGAAAPVPTQDFLALAYGDLAAPDARALFTQQMNELQRQGYAPVSVDDVIAAHIGQKVLPAKAVLLSFDGGWASFATVAYPVLKKNHYPALLAVDDARIKQDRTHALLDWTQLRALQKKGLVTLASYGHALKNVVANPQGDLEPAAVTLPYDAKKHAYASPSVFAHWLAQDIETSAQNIAGYTNLRPRVMVWPSGAYSQFSVDLAARHGMAVTLTLDPKIANTHDLSAVPRLAVKLEGGAAGLASQMVSVGKHEPMRAIQADIDYVYDTDAVQMKRNIAALVERVQKLGANAVFLQAFADPTGSELTRMTYFPNASLPMRADLFNHIAWLLKTQAGVKVYGWIPMFSFDLGDKVDPVMHWDAQAGKAMPTTNGYHRVSLFDPRARQIIGDLFVDMARHGAIDGVLFHDDSLLTDYEDASPSAMQAYKKAGFPDTVAEIRSDRAVMDKWTAFKTSALIDFTAELTARLRQIRAPLYTVRNIYASPVLNIRSEEWYAQSYQQFLHAYDMTAIEAMPQMEEVPDDQAGTWMENLVQKAAATEPGALDKTLFELQSVDWRKAKLGQNRAIPTAAMTAQMRMLAAHGAVNYGYYPDDFHANIPEATTLRDDFAVKP